MWISSSVFSRSGTNICVPWKLMSCSTTIHTTQTFQCIFTAYGFSYRVKIMTSLSLIRNKWFNLHLWYFFIFLRAIFMFYTLTKSLKTVVFCIFSVVTIWSGPLMLQKHNGSSWKFWQEARSFESFAEQNCDWESRKRLRRLEQRDARMTCRTFPKKKAA